MKVGSSIFYRAHLTLCWAGIVTFINNAIMTVEKNLKGHCTSVQTDLKTRISINMPQSNQEKGYTVQEDRIVYMPYIISKLLAN